MPMGVIIYEWVLEEYLIYAKHLNHALNGPILTMNYESSIPVKFSTKVRLWIIEYVKK